jgi:hypothetical protein
MLGDPDRVGVEQHSTFECLDDPAPETTTTIPPPLPRLAGAR